MAKAYIRNTWVNDAPPAINETNLNNAETGINRNNRLDLSISHNITADIDYTLTSDQNDYGRIEITDTNPFLTVGRNIIVDNNEHTFLFVNSTLQTLTVKTIAGTGIEVPTGTAKELRNDTVNVIEFEATPDFSLLGTLDTNNYFHAVEEKPNLQSAGNSIAGEQERILNTVKTNTITGASLVSNQIPLPAGDYLVIGSTPIYNNAGSSKAIIHNVTDGVDIAIGKNIRSATAAGTQVWSNVVTPVFTLASTKTISLRQYITSAVSLGLGYGGISDSNVETYSEIQIWKVG